MSNSPRPAHALAGITEKGLAWLPAFLFLLTAPSTSVMIVALGGVLLSILFNRKVVFRLIPPTRKLAPLLSVRGVRIAGFIWPASLAGTALLITRPTSLPIWASYVLAFIVPVGWRALSDISAAAVGHWNKDSMPKKVTSAFFRGVLMLVIVVGTLTFLTRDMNNVMRRILVNYVSAGIIANMVQVGNVVAQSDPSISPLREGKYAWVKPVEKVVGIIYLVCTGLVAAPIAAYSILMAAGGVSFNEPLVRRYSVLIPPSCNMLAGVVVASITFYRWLRNRRKQALPVRDKWSTYSKNLLQTGGMVGWTNTIMAIIGGRVSQALVLPFVHRHHLTDPIQLLGGNDTLLRVVVYANSGLVALVVVLLTRAFYCRSEESK